MKTLKKIEPGEYSVSGQRRELQAWECAHNNLVDAVKELQEHAKAMAGLTKLLNDPEYSPLKKERRYSIAELREKYKKWLGRSIPKGMQGFFNWLSEEDHA